MMIAAAIGMIGVTLQIAGCYDPDPEVVTMKAITPPPDARR
jgi:hypothetical protein